MPGVTEREIAQAKQMNLYQYMQLCEPDNFKPEGPGQFRHKGHSSLSFAENGTSRQLEEMGLLHIRKVGVQRIMQSEDSPKTLFQKAGDKLLNPINRTVYIPKELVGTEQLESGYSALAEYSMLNTPNVRCYAAERISQWKDVMTNSLQNSQVQVAVEMWRYNPRKLSTRNNVDELSLALALREDADERVEEAVEEMLNELWGRIDGYRN